MRGTMILAAALGATLPLCAVDGTLLATSGESPSFDAYGVDGRTIAAKSLAEIADLPPVTWRAGETVTMTKCDGTETILAAAASSSAGSASIAPDAGGIWTLVNSVQGTARIGIPWSVYGDGGMLASDGIDGTYGVDSMQPGPDRKVKLRDLPPVAYSGDSWVGDVSKAATLTFTAPDRTATTRNLSGTGAEPFLMEPGIWTVRLEMEDGTAHTAVLKVTETFSISFR